MGRVLKIKGKQYVRPDVAREYLSCTVKTYKQYVSQHRLRVVTVGKRIFVELSMPLFAGRCPTLLASKWGQGQVGALTVEMILRQARVG